MDEPVEIFLHDSLHTPEHELADFSAISSRLSENSVVLSDYAHASASTADSAEQNGRSYLFFAEEPRGPLIPRWRLRRRLRPKVSCRSGAHCRDRLGKAREALHPDP